MDKRLLACAALCKGERIADIGTDHGYLPCYMVSNGLCKTALACDVGEKPLQSAKAHIAENGLDDKITALLSDGLENVPLDGVTDIIIAGMGGELIISILEKCSRIKSLKEPINLVLQPMTRWDVLRKWLYENGFEVTGELPCVEGKFSYSVIQARYSGKIPETSCGLHYLYCGTVTPDTKEGREYLKRQAMRLESAGKGRLSSPENHEEAEEMLRLSKNIFNSVSTYMTAETY